MPYPNVTQTRLVPSAVVTMSFALEVQVGREPGPPGAIAIVIAPRSFSVSFSDGAVGFVVLPSHRGEPPARPRLRGDRVMGWMAPLRHLSAKLLSVRIS